MQMYLYYFSLALLVNNCALLAMHNTPSINTKGTSAAKSTDAEESFAREIQSIDGIIGELSNYKKMRHIPFLDTKSNKLISAGMLSRAQAMLNELIEIDQKREPKNK